MIAAREARAPRAGDPVPWDLVVLTYDERYLRRKVIDTVHGEPVLVDLAEVRGLADRDRLVLEDGRHVEVIAAEEELIAVRGDLARLAWHIGNRHAPCQIEAGRLVIRHDHVLADMLVRLGAEVAHVSEPFNPEGGAYGHGRTHGHAHAPHAHADPDAHLHSHD